MKFIELFAGCGGMSLGLKSEGFKFYMGNELSPMAGETYAYNLLNENLQDQIDSEKVHWIKSQYKKDNITRLRENPFLALKGEISDLDNVDDFSGKLLIGDINSLLVFLKAQPKILAKIKSQSIDLIAGGPPCQSFSLAGRRDKDNNRNQLPWAFSEFVGLVKPKYVLLENVSGILRPFTEGTNKYYAWFEVAKAFTIKGYVPICMHINAKYFGLPQNRPRFIMLGINADLLNKLPKDEILSSSIDFYTEVRNKKGALKINDFPSYKFYELNGEKDAEYFVKSLYLPTPTHLNKDKKFITVSFGINAFKHRSSNFNPRLLKTDPFYNILEKAFGHLNPNSNYLVKNLDLRAHSYKIQNRFRFLKLVEKYKNGDKVKLIQALKNGTSADLDAGLMKDLIKRFDMVNDSQDLENFFTQHKTKKHSQRALIASQPAPAALSIPDDVCHYDPKLNRTLTVREMARIQSFPDWFEFRSKDTTGGTNRRFEVPNYTQVGNAVPPLLAKVLGNWIKEINKTLK